MFGELLKATIGVVTTPISLAADVITLGGSLTDKDKPYTAQQLEDVYKNLQDAIKPDSR